jgi:hypothetical protein
MKHPRIRVHLEQLGFACLEVSRRPELVGVLINILRIAVPTLAALSEDGRVLRVRGPWLRRIAVGR